MSIIKNVDKFFGGAGVIFIIIFIWMGAAIPVLLGYGVIFLALGLIFFAYMIRSRSIVLDRIENLGGIDHNVSKEVNYSFTSPFFSPNVFFTLLFVFLLSVLCVTLFLPSPLAFIQDQDWAHQLAGANQILKGEHPFNTFLDNYGPLTFYSSALAQIIFGTRVIGEIVLITLGFALAYMVLFWLMWTITQDKLLSFMFLIILLILIPKLYKYYIILGPAISLLFIWMYVDNPLRKRLWFVGSAVVVTGLFRPDFGLYMFFSAVTAILLNLGRAVTIKQKIKDLLYFVGTLLVLASPWLIFVTIGGGLRDYLYFSTIGMVVAGSGMSLPLSFSGNIMKDLQIIGTISFNLVPSLSLILMLYRRHNMLLEDVTKLSVLIVASQLTLIQGLHRNGWPHLLQAIPLTFVLLAYLFKQIFLSISGKGRKISFFGLGIGIGLLSMVLVYSLPSIADISLRKTFSTLKIYSLQRDQFTELLIQNNPKNSLLQAMNYVITCTEPDDKIIAWPYLIDFYYFTDRPLGGRFKGIAPIFNGSDDEKLIVRNMEADNIAYFIFRPYSFSKKANEIQDYAPVISKYLQKTYVAIKQFGKITIYINRNHLPTVDCSSQ